jgi:hypothetical protein
MAQMNFMTFLMGFILFMFLYILHINVRHYFITSYENTNNIEYILIGLFITVLFWKIIDYCDKHIFSK